MRILVFILCFITLSAGNIFALKDSIGMKTVDGKRYIMHQVDKSEGLFSVSRRYGVSVDAIRAANDQIENLALNQVILVPAPKVISEEKKFKHTVEKGETLYKISKLYNVSVDNLKKWNNLTDDAIKVGSDLLIIQIVKYNEVESPKKEEVVANGNKQEEDLKYEKKNPGAKEITEEGIATWIEDPSVNSRQALALHKTAPAGTIIRVTNLLTHKELYVKVVGTIPTSQGQSNEIIRLSKYAAKQLKIKDQITRVKVSYYPEN